MIAVIQPGKLSGTVRAPASKSAAHRALIAAALADAPTLLRMEGGNRDIEATVSCLRALGARIEAAPEGLRVAPGRAPARADLDCGESGSTLRFLLPVACALGVNARITGRGRLPARPNADLTGALRAHGAAIDSDALPMTACGPVSAGLWTLPGDVSSQFVTGQLLALPLLEGNSEIALTTPLQSAAYVDMTLKMLLRFGVAAETTEFGWRVPGGQRYRSPGTVEIEGDWSAAAFWLAANAMGSDIRVTGLPEDTAQGDRAVVPLLGRREIDVSGVPDLAPALAVAAAARPHRTIITGAARLRIKESDRLAAIADLLGALGGSAEIRADELIIEGGRTLRGGTVNGCGDHRIVMAAAIAATIAEGPVRVTDAEAAAKSYPGFFRDFEELGGRVYVEQPGR